MTDHTDALRLIEKAVLSLQAQYAPGRPAFYALGHLRNEVRRTMRALPTPNEPVRLGGLDVSTLP